MKIRYISAVMMPLFCILGIHGAYTGKLALAVFFGIAFAGETIAVSIDYWAYAMRKSDENSLL